MKYIYGAKTHILKNGQEVGWRRDLTKRLLDAQKWDGFWENETGRFWEKDPVLVSSYAILIRRSPGEDCRKQ